MKTKNTWHLLVLIAWASTGLVLSACTSTGTDTPTPVQPQTATLSGLIQPAEAVSDVTATDASNKKITGTIDAVTGRYTFASLPPGTYTLNFYTLVNAGYIPILPRAITVVAGSNTGPTIAINKSAVSFTVDGTTNITPAYVVCAPEPLGRNLQLSDSESSPTFALSIYIKDATLPVGSRSASGYYRVLAGGTALMYSATSCTFNITGGFYTYPRLFSGNFRFVGALAAPTGTAPPTKTIEGTFTDVYW